MSWSLQPHFSSLCSLFPGQGPFLSSPDLPFSYSPPDALRLFSLLSRSCCSHLPCNHLILLTWASLPILPTCTLFTHQPLTIYSGQHPFVSGQFILAVKLISVTFMYIWICIYLPACFPVYLPVRYYFNKSLKSSCRLLLCLHLGPFLCCLTKTWQKAHRETIQWEPKRSRLQARWWTSVQ